MYTMRVRVTTLIRAIEDSRVLSVSGFHSKYRRYILWGKITMSLSESSLKR